MTQNKNYTVPIIMMIMLFGMISFVTNLAAPMGIVLKSQFAVTNFLGLLGNAANFIAYAVMGIPSGILLQRIGYKKTALIAVAVGFVGVGIQYLSGYSSQDSAFAVYLAGAFVAGFSMCLLNTVVNPMLNTLGGGGNKGNQLIQVGGSFNSVMATATPMIVGILIGDAAKARITDIFPFMYAAMAVFAIVFVVLYSLIFVTQPLNAISPIDQKFFELIVPIATFLTGTLSGIMLAGTSKEDKEAMLQAQKNAQSNTEAAAKMTIEQAKVLNPAPSYSTPMRSVSPLAEATVMPVFEAGDPTHRNSRND